MRELWTWTLFENGMKTASGFGSEDACRREASHYAMMYGQDGGSVAVTIKPPCKKQPPPASD